MPDLFLSYSREDQATARQYADALGRAGFNVWWDQTLRSGEAYDEVTERALREAKAVVVLWSKASVASRWVRAEATIADRKGTLVPAMIEGCDRPVMFELTQTAELAGWHGDANDARWRAFIEDIRRKIDHADPNAAVRESAAVAVPEARKKFPVAMLVTALALATVAFVVWQGQRKPANGQQAAQTATVESASVAVLPFTNLTGEADKEYFSDGMAEELINALAKVPGLKVASRTSSFAYKGQTTDIRKIARDLDVSTVLEGSVRSAGDRVRITAQLINAESGYHVWSETYDRDFKDLFALQDDLARQIVTSFQRATNQQLPAYQTQGPPTRDLEAYSLYLQGTSLTGQNNDLALRRAIELLEKSVARDPQFGRAYLALGIAQFLLGRPNSEVELNARRASELDPDAVAQAQMLVAGTHAKQGNWLRAEEQLAGVPLARSTADFPGFGPTLTTWWPTGQMNRVLTYYENLVRDAPASSIANLLLGMAYASRGRDREARSSADAAVALGVDPTGRRIRQVYAELDARAGDFDAASAGMKAALSPGAKAAGAEAVVDAVYAAYKDPKRRPEAVVAVQRLLPKLPPEEWIVKVWSMYWFSQLGRTDLAFNSGEQVRLQFGAQTPVNAWAWLWAPELSALRRDAAFQPFVTKLGMMPYWEKYGPPDDCELANGKLTCR